MFIFSLHCEGDKKCWLRQWHADTRKHLLDVEVGFPLKLKLVFGRKANEATGQIVSRVCAGLFYLCEKTKALVVARNKEPTVRGVAEPQELRGRPLIFD